MVPHAVVGALPRGSRTLTEEARLSSSHHRDRFDHSDRPERLSFDEVYERHFRSVWRVLQASGLPAWAVADAAQEVFVVVHRRLPEFEYRSDIRTWLFRIARWEVTRERRRLRRTADHDEVGEEVTDESARPDDQASRNEAIRTLEKILSLMDPDKRMAFLLMDIEGMKASEVAELLEINVNTVYSRLRLAREQFKTLLADAQAREKGNEP